MSFKNFMKIAQRAGKEFVETGKEALHDIKEDLKSQDTKLSEVLKKVDDPNVSSEEVKASIKKMVLGNKYTETPEEQVRKLEAKLRPELDKFVQKAHLDPAETLELDTAVTELIATKDPEIVKYILKRVRKVNDDLVEANKAVVEAAKEAEDFMEELKDKKTPDTNDDPIE